jgi:hypothetical protein
MSEYCTCATSFDGSCQLHDRIDALTAENLSLREQVAALESREVCTVAHENVETCGYCQRDALTAENAALREERALIIQRAENAEAALVESDALLREMLAWKVAIECIAPELGGAIMTLARIDAHLARNSHHE